MADLATTPTQFPWWPDPVDLDAIDGLFSWWHKMLW